MPYPPSVPPNSRTNLTAQDTAHPSDHNTIANALTDIINELGSDPSGAAATVQARIAAIEANSWVTAARIADGTITSAKIADGTIATADIGDSQITSAKIADGTIATADIADGTITSAKIADGTIATADIADGQITSAKIAGQAFTGGNQGGVNLVPGIGFGGYSELRYHKLGKVVFFYNDIKIGSSGYSVGAVQLDAVSTAATVGNVAWQHNYTVKYYDASSGNWFGGHARWVSAARYELLAHTEFGVELLAPLSATFPFTWAPDDRIMVSGWYEEA